MNTYKFKIMLSANSGKKGEGLRIEEERMHPKAEMYREGHRKLIILGSPIYNNIIENSVLSKKLFKANFHKSLIKELDGSFLLICYDENSLDLTIINDRFASMPFYYYCDDKGFIGSVNYSDIWDELGGAQDVAINNEAFYEFIHMQRLFGNKTYDRKTRYLNSAAVLTYNAVGNDLKPDRYWRPSLSKKYRSPKETSHILADLVSEAISKRTNDGKRYGLLLSGGLDSRLILAGFQKPVKCATIGARQNNEYFVAQELAKARGRPHAFIKRHDSHYADILEDAVSLGSAMNMYVHAHFLNMDEELGGIADVFFHGHGFDYMFQGKYLPCSPVKIFNKKTYMKRIIDVDKDIKTAFFNQVSYRMKSIDPLSLVIDKEKERVKESVYSSLESVLDEGRDCCDNGYDLWEYLIMHNLSRHYTFLNVRSIRTIAEERTIAFDNQLFDFYLSLPIESRLNRNVFVDAIRLLDERLYRIKNANTNFNIYDSDFTLTGKLCINKTLRRFGFNATLPPAQRDRSWPLKADIINGNSKIREITKNLINSGVLGMLGFLDMDKVKLYVEKHLDGKGDCSDAILTLITIDTFLKRNSRVVQKVGQFDGCKKGC